MGLLQKLIPFYGAIEKVIEGDQDRRTMRTEAELKIKLATEIKKQISFFKEKERNAQHVRDMEKIMQEEKAKDYKSQQDHARQIELEKMLSELREAEKDADHKRELERLMKEEEAKDYIALHEYERQINFEKHRVDMFERIKRLDVEIHEQISLFSIDKQKEIAEWQRQFMEKMEHELFITTTEKMPKMLHTAEAFKDNPVVYNQFIQRIMETYDKLTQSITADQEQFRQELAIIASEPHKLTASLLELNQKIVLSPDVHKSLPS